MMTIIVLVSSGLIGYLNYIKIVDITLKTAEGNLTSKGKLLAARMQNRYDDIEKDVRILSRTPPIQGLIRTLNNNHLDPLDKSTTRLWQIRLAQIFRSMLQDNPAYKQIRYIGLSQDGRELVRVERSFGKIVTKTNDNLQQKAREPYMQRVIKGENHFFFSPNVQP